ncbi:MAG: ABC transporter permease [Chloroflexota bacterium]
MDTLHYLAGNWDTIGPEVKTHLQIVVISMVVAAIAGLLLGILAARSARFAVIALSVASTLLTIPSFALFGLLAIGLGIGNRPVEIGLILYALLPILRNTMVGIQGVDPAVLEAARGMGMRLGQVLRRVELPLALPLILGGLRQSTVMIVAIATVGAAVGANDLGQPILAGIRDSDNAEILSGIIPVAAIGLLADAVLGSAQRLLQRGRIVEHAA